MDASGEQMDQLFTDAFNARDADRLAALATDDVEIYPLRSVLEDVVYRGREGMHQWVADLNESWAHLHIELVETHAHPSGVRFVVGHVVARGHESDAHTEADVYWVVETRDGAVRRLRTWVDRAPAEAALADALAAPEPIRAGADAFRAIDKRDLAAWRGLAERLWTEDIEMVEEPRWPGAGTFRGREEVAARFHEYFEALDDGEVQIEGAEPGDDGQFVLQLLLRARGAESGVPIEQRWGWVIRVRDGRLASIRPYLDLAEARAAAGVASA